ncbi:MAG: hypothetical protein H6992_14915 [Pseudomonadales bacterium]|nr:hypothetical protein [Pseudomonadales bacterium]
MRQAWVVALLVLAGCAGPGPQPPPDPEAPPAIACSDPRPEVCTMQYDPACAELAAGGRREYASPCNACADPAVAAYRSGSCPQ